MVQKIDTVTENDFDTLTEVWEASVRATHTFLTEDNIQFFKPLVRKEFLSAVELRCVRDENSQPVGFLGVTNEKIEMLFIHPDARGKGIGKQLLEYAVEQMNAKELDVNEQNEQAIGYYKRMGFEVVGRTDVDGLGKPFPLLQMKYASQER
jgi:putative acetyltransferase